MIRQLTLVLAAVAGLAHTAALAQDQQHAAIAASEMTLLVPRAEVIADCGRKFKESGLECSIDGAEPTPFNMGLAGISMTNGEAKNAGLVEPWEARGRNTLGRPVFGLLRLSSKKTDAGFDYFTATSTVYVTDLSTRTLIETKQFDKQFWSEVAFSAPIASSASPDAEQFLAKSDARLIRD